MRLAEGEFAEALAVIGVHAGKFTRERQSAAILDAMRREDIRHPVVNDGDYRIWDSYGVRAWPTLILIDASGRTVARQEGEAPYAELRLRIEREIKGATRRGGLAPRPVPIVAPQVAQGPLRYPGGLFAAPDGTLYISDSGHHRILRWREDTGVTGVWGDGSPGLADGGAEDARFRDPHGLALVGETLWIADSGNHALRRVDLRSGRVGTAWRPAQGDEAPLGPGTLRSPWALATDGDRLFIAVAGSHQIWLLDLARGTLVPFAGSGYEALYDADLARSRLAQPMALAVGQERLLVADAESSAVRVLPLEAPGRVATLVGKGLFDFGDRQGSLAETLLQHPQGIACIGDAVYVADTYNDQIVRLDLPRGESSAVLEGLREPTAIASLGGELFVADTGHHRILRWVPGSPRAAVVLG